MITCNCPAAAALPSIGVLTCGENFGQIQKLIFQRVKKSDGSKNGLVAADAVKLAKWQPLLAANDDTKIVVTPYVSAPATEPGSPRTFGGGNDSVDGIEEIIGTEPTAFTGVFRKLPQSMVKKMKEIACESQMGGNIGVYLIGEGGRIGCVADESTQDQTTVKTYRPIPIRSLFFGDKNFGGLEEPDSNAVQWSFPPNYSDDFSILVPEDFNPLTDLVETA